MDSFYRLGQIVVPLLWEIVLVGGTITFGILLGSEKRKRKNLSPDYKHSRLITWRVLFYMFLGQVILQITAIVGALLLIAMFMESM